MLFVEAPRTRDDLARIVSALGPSLPLMANMVEGGKTPTLSGGRTGGDRLCAGDLPRRASCARSAAWRASSTPRSRPTAPTSRSATACSTSRHQRADRHARDDRARPAIRDAAPADKKRAFAGDLARSGHACGAQRPPRPDRRRDGRDALPLGVQSDHRRGARRLPRPLSRRDRRDPGAGHLRPADLRRRHGLRGQGRDRQGRARRRSRPPATPISSTTPTTAARTSTISAWCVR